MKKIPLTRGKYAIVDDDDFDRVSQFSWCDSQGYATRGVEKPENKTGKGTQRMHHFILGLPSSQVVDHWNRDTRDNRKENLRPCTHSQNHQNKVKHKGKGRFKGASWCARDERWVAHISFNGKHMHISSHGNEEDAAIAYNVAAQLFFGEFAVLNDI